MVLQRQHSVVHSIEIASPCQASWDAMLGDDRSRHCQSCSLNVYNVAGMTLEEAEELIISGEGKVCLRLFRRTDGTVITKDCPIGFKELVIGSARRVSFVSASCLLAVVLFCSLLMQGLRRPSKVMEACTIKLQAKVAEAKSVLADPPQCERKRRFMGTPNVWRTEHARLPRMYKHYEVNRVLSAKDLGLDPAVLDPALLASPKDTK